jgi:hypothetical protein
MIPHRRWQDRQPRRPALERAVTPLIRILAVALAVTVATAAAIHALHGADVPGWLQPLRSAWV